MKKIYLTVDKEWLLENYPKMTLKEMCDNNIIQDKPFGKSTGEEIVWAKRRNPKKPKEDEN